MNDWLTEALHDAADRNVGDVVLEDPRLEASEEDRSTTNPSGPPLLAVAAVLVALAIVAGVWLVGRDDSTTVDAVDPATTDAPTTTTDPADADDVVRAALDRTMATSWVGQLSVGNEDPTVPSLEATVVYHPADPAAGRPYAAVLLEGPAVERPMLALSSSARVIEACAESDRPPCRPGAWAGLSGWAAADVGLGADELRTLQQASMTLVENVDPASAEPLGEGRYAVTLSALSPCDVGCGAEMSVEDGRIVRLTLLDEGAGVRELRLGSFGEAPAVDEPAAGDVVQGALVTGRLCEVTIATTADADPAAIESAVRRIESELGLDDAAAAMRAIRGIDGVADVSTNTSDGCPPGALTIGFR